MAVFLMAEVVFLLAEAVMMGALMVAREAGALGLVIRLRHHTHV
jgi:hypothetical protein